MYTPHGSLASASGVIVPPEHPVALTLLMFPGFDASENSVLPLTNDPPNDMLHMTLVPVPESNVNVPLLVMLPAVLISTGLVESAPAGTTTTHTAANANNPAMAERNSDPRMTALFLSLPVSTTSANNRTAEAPD